jgi:hypothetical protein
MRPPLLAGLHGLVEGGDRGVDVGLGIVGGEEGRQLVSQRAPQVALQRCRSSTTLIGGAAPPL